MVNKAAIHNHCFLQLYGSSEKGSILSPFIAKQTKPAATCWSKGYHRPTLASHLAFVITSLRNFYRLFSYRQKEMSMGMRKCSMTL